MNTFLAFLWKEWRAQRGLLAAYMALACATLTAALLFIDRAQLSRAAALSLFVNAGFIGLLVFAAQQTVRAEFTGRDDQFLRRLPGALPAAFAAKLCFLAFAGVALPMVGLLAGVVALSVAGRGTPPLEELMLRGLALEEVGSITAVGTPWVFAIAFWLPAARMAAGVVALLGVSLVTAFWRLVQTHHGLGKTLEYGPFLPWLATVGLLVAWIGCVRGRRGGTYLRSAKLAGTATAIVLLLFAVPIATQVAEHRNPDATAMQYMSSPGLSVDRRCALLNVRTRHEWPTFPAVVDLVTGKARTLGARGEYVSWSLPRSMSSTQTGPRDLWWIQSLDSRLFDAVSSESWAHDSDELRGVLDERLASTIAATSRFRQPGNRPAWVMADRVYLQESDGSVTDLPLPSHGYWWLRPAGHGIVGFDKSGRPLAFDLHRRRTVTHPKADSPRVFAVEGTWLLLPEKDRNRPGWSRFDPDTGTTSPCSGLESSAYSPWLLRDGEVLLADSDSAGSFRVQRYVVAEDRAEPLASLPTEFVGHKDIYTPSDTSLPYGLRDPKGRLLLSVYRRGSPAVVLLAIDPVTLQCDVVLRNPRMLEILAFDRDGTVIATEDQRRIVRIDPNTNVKTILFPREPSK